MTQKVRRTVRLLVLLLLLAGGYRAYIYIRAHPAQVDAVLARLGWRPTGREADVIYAYGTIEATKVQVMTLIPGRVRDVTVDEGDVVSPGQVLIRLDDTLLQKQLAVAQAQIDAAQAQLALLEAGPRPEELARAQAQVDAARVALDVATQALEDTRAVRDAAQDVQPDIIRAETELAKARHQRDAALALAQAADITAQMWEKIVNQVQAGAEVRLPDGTIRHVPPPPEKLNEVNYQWNLASQQAWEAWAQYHQAEAAVAAAQAALDAAQARLDDPARDAHIAQAQGNLVQARAGLALAQATLGVLQSGPSAEQIDAARANVTRAQAAYERLRAQRAFYTITAPQAGRVVQRAIEPGEVALPGRPLITLADLDTLRLTLYIPEPDLGHISLGQEVTVLVDAYPNRAFRGTVIHIADEAEFTPKNVQTKEDRAILVYAVDVAIPNPEGLLKPGMPADAIIRK